MNSEPNDLLRRLRELSSTVVADVLDECGYPDQALHSSIRPLDDGMLLAGRAVCFAGHSVVRGAPEDPAALSTYTMDARIAPGAVAVIATHGHAVGAVVGGLMALSFSRRGAAGILSDGGVRDASEIIALGLAAFSRFTTPLRSNGRWQLTAADGAVRLPGQSIEEVSVEPGDYVIGDADGVVVIPAAIASEVVGWSEQLTSIERTIESGLKTGQPREKVFGENPRFKHIRRLR